MRFVEVTVNGPKSWSLAAELHPDIATTYDAAQDRAADQVIAWLSQHATTRVGPRGAQVQVPVEALEAATVSHHTSRAGDPHRHLHLQINARVFAASQWRGLHTVGVRDSLNAINGIGHSAVLTDPAFRTALAAHGYSVDASGEITQLAPYVGAFSKRADQVRRNLDRYERDWTATHPGQHPGPALRRAWDARAWADARPDKVTPHPGADLNRRWLDELAELGYVDRDQPIRVAAVAIGGLDRDRAADEVIARLGAARSAWNAADIRGEVEQLLARTGIVTPASVRTELAEDLTARALTLSVALLDRTGVPEHIRALTSEQVVTAEADLIARFAARGNVSHHGVTPAGYTGTALDRIAPVRFRGLDAAQTAAATVLAGEHALVVVQGAAGAGKTTNLAATAGLLDLDGHAMVVVTPTLKAARVAATELGRLERDPAILTQPRGYLDAARSEWAVDRDLAADLVRQQAIAAAARRDELAGRDRIRPTPTPQPAPERDHGISR